jgi:hypothetical protein
MLGDPPCHAQPDSVMSNIVGDFFAAGVQALDHAHGFLMARLVDGAIAHVDRHPICPGESCSGIGAVWGGDEEGATITAPQCGSGHHLQLALVLQGPSSQAAHGLGAAWSVGLLQAPLVERAQYGIVQSHDNLFAGTGGGWTPDFLALVFASTN